MCPYINTGNYIMESSGDGIEMKFYVISNKWNINIIQ